MSGPAPTFAGWYSDPESGGTKFWDGSRWTGDTRPRRKPFAAPAAYRREGAGAVVLGGILLASSPFAGPLNDGSTPTVGLFLVLLLPGLVAAAAGVCLLRGQGPTTTSVVDRDAGRRESADAAERKVAELRRHAPTTSTDTTAAQITALANPDTARALQNSRNLLYTTPSPTRSTRRRRRGRSGSGGSCRSTVDP